MENTATAKSATTRSNTVRRLVESAILIAIGTVLSIFAFPSFWPLGGGITFCSMLPLVLLAHRYGTKWGVFSALVFGLLQMVLGIQNVQWATSVWTALAIILLDYLIAFGVIGLSAVFNKVIKTRLVSIEVGIVFTFLLRLACHYFSGVFVWDRIFPNELGWAAPIWSIAYNGSFMLAEILITGIVAALIFVPLKKFFTGEDLK